MRTKYRIKRCKYNKSNKYRKVVKAKAMAIANEPYPDQMLMANAGNVSARNTGPRIALGRPT